MFNLNTYFDKIYYVNLDKDIERNENILKQFEYWKITNYKRFSAVKIETLPEPYLYRNFVNKDFKYILGSLGCRASHLEIIKDAKVNSYNKILIFEDDIEIQQDPHQLLSKSKHREDWDMLYFGGFVDPKFKNYIKLTHAYAISKKLYDDVIYMAESSGREIDVFYAKIIQQLMEPYIIETIRPFNTINQLRKIFESNIIEK